MSYDPTQQVPPPQGYPPQGYPQQPGYTQQGYPSPQPPAPQTYQQYSGGPAPTGAGFDFNALWKNLGLTGQVCLISGVVLFISLLLPWFSAGTSCSGDCTGFSSVSFNFNGWAVATNNGSSVDASSFIFTLVWLVILASIALIAIPIITALGKFNARQGQMFALIAAGVALLIEIIYMIRAFSILSGVNTSETSGNTTVSGSAGPGFGFWLGLLATLAAGGVYVYFNYMKKPAVGSYAQPYQQPGQYPGSQPYQQPGQYPGSQPYQQPPQYPGQYPGQQPPQYPGQ